MTQGQFKIQIPSELRERLDREAEAKNISVAEAIRQRVVFSFTVDPEELAAARALRTLVRYILKDH